MQFKYTIFYVQDVRQTVEFYEKALKMKCAFMHESGDYAELETGSIKLAFAAESMREFNGIETLNNRPENTPPGVEIGFDTNDVQGDYDFAIENGALPEKEPTEKPWGQTVAYLKDINGILIALGTPME